MKFLSFILLLLFLSSCSSTSTKNQKLSQRERPKWIENPVEFCGEEKICAVGEADGYLRAEIVARDNIAKVFETKVRSDSQYELESKSKMEEEVVKGITQEDSNRKIKENTEMVLEGVQIVDKYTDDEASYVLASLKKSKAARLFKKRIEAIDEEIYSLYRTNRRSKLAKAIKLIRIRETLHDRYLIVRNIKVTPKVSLERVIKRRDDLVKVGTVLYVDFEKSKKFSQFNDLLIQKLLDLGYRVITTPKREYEYKVVSEIKTRESYLNVEGFKKFKVSNNIVSTNSKGEKIGSLYFETEEVGRSRLDSINKAILKMANNVTEKIDELNID